MLTDAPPRRTIAVPAAAAAAADRNWRANHAALLRHQPAMAAALDACPVGGTWATARDGSLAVRDGHGRWAAGCSVPGLAGRALVRSLVVEPGGHCLLAPAFAGLVAAIRERLGPDPVLFVVQPDLTCCRQILGAIDVADDLAAGRLWFAGGAAWPVEFRHPFDAHAGLAAPARFVQTRLTPDAAVAPLIEAAQQVIGAVTAARSCQFDGWAVGRRTAVPGRTLVLGGSRFRLWTPGTDVLRAAVGGGTDYNTDDPLTAAPLAFAAAADGAAAVVAADVGRGQAAPVLATGARWVTWVTRPAIPPHAAAGPQDSIILADAGWRRLATAAGWPAERVRVGVCPPLLPPLPPPRIASLGLVCDTRPIALPDAVRDYSSRRLLWEAIEAELRDAPLAATDPAAYVADRAKRAGLAAEEIDLPLFVERLVLPGYAQGLARLLIAARLPTTLWGSGWDELVEFRDQCAGPVTDATAFQAAVATSTALVRYLPGRDWHPLTAAGRPVLAAEQNDASEWLSRAAALLCVSNRTAAACVTPTLAAAVAASLGR